MSAQRSPSKEYHHGRTPAGWAGSVLAALAFVLGAIGMMLGPNWTLLWVSIVLLVLSVVAGSLLRRMGYGQE